MPEKVEPEKAARPAREETRSHSGPGKDPIRALAEALGGLVVEDPTFSEALDRAVAYRHGVVLADLGSEKGHRLDLEVYPSMYSTAYWLSEEIPETTFLRRLRHQLAGRSWLLDLIVSRPFRLRVTIPTDSADEAAHYCLALVGAISVDIDSVLSFDFRRQERDPASLAFLAIRTSGSVTSVDVSVARVVDGVKLTLQDPLAFVDFVPTQDWRGLTSTLDLVAVDIAERTRS